jgi:glutamyl-tRNA(Gln) amidotransferase subunit D
MHSSYRSTFRTIGDIPIGMVSRDTIVPLRKDYARRRTDTDVTINTAFEERVSIVYYYPNMRPDIIDALIDNGYRGIVIAGTGLGHVNKPLYPSLKRAKEKNIAVYMTVQTLWGYVQMYVYDTGRDMMELGVMPTANMLPEVAYCKLGWALGQTDDLEKVREIMMTPIAGEITEREPSNGYLIFQGGIPEVEEFISRYRK